MHFLDLVKCLPEDDYYLFFDLPYPEQAAIQANVEMHFIDIENIRKCNNNGVLHKIRNIYQTSEENRKAFLEYYDQITEGHAYDWYCKLTRGVENEHLSKNSGGDRQGGENTEKRL